MVALIRFALRLPRFDEEAARMIHPLTQKSLPGEQVWAENHSATGVEAWSVMVKDTQGRFPNNPLWGGGWGWVLFNSDNPRQTVTKNWRTDCLGCHAPAKRTDWVFVEGYPILPRQADEK
jgi:hypothetical protein